MQNNSSIIVHKNSGQLLTAVHIQKFLRIIEADVLKKILLKSVSHDY